MFCSKIIVNLQLTTIRTLYYYTTEQKVLAKSVIKIGMTYKDDTWSKSSQVSVEDVATILVE